MSSALEIAAASLRAEQQALEALANNVANINTTGFKRVEADFSQVMARTAQSADIAPSTGADNSPNAVGVRFDQRAMIFEQGEMRETGSALDVAIDGRGFIELMGPRGQSYLWRGGTLRVNEDGMLATESGMPLRALANIPQDAVELSIAADGIITVRTSAEEQIEVGQIRLVSIDHEDAVERMDRGLLRLREETRATEGIAGEDGFGRFSQGMVEESNVDLSSEMVQMMIVQRAFAASAQVIQAADQLASITNNLRR